MSVISCCAILLVFTLLAEDTVSQGLIDSEIVYRTMDVGSKRGHQAGLTTQGSLYFRGNCQAGACGSSLIGNTLSEWREFAEEVYHARYGLPAVHVVTGVEHTCWVFKGTGGIFCVVVEGSFMGNYFGNVMDNNGVYKVRTSNMITPVVALAPGGKYVPGSFSSGDYHMCGYLNMIDYLGNVVTGGPAMYCFGDASRSQFCFGPNEASVNYLTLYDMRSKSTGFDNLDTVVAVGNTTCLAAGARENIEREIDHFGETWSSEFLDSQTYNRRSILEYCCGPGNQCFKAGLFGDIPEFSRGTMSCVDSQSAIENWDGQSIGDCNGGVDSGFCRSRKYPDTNDDDVDVPIIDDDFNREEQPETTTTTLTTVSTSATTIGAQSEPTPGSDSEAEPGSESDMMQSTGASQPRNVADDDDSDDDDGKSKDDDDDDDNLLVYIVIGVGALAAMSIGCFVVVLLMRRQSGNAVARANMGAPQSHHLATKYHRTKSSGGGVSGRSGTSSRRGSTMVRRSGHYRSQRNSATYRRSVAMATSMSSNNSSGGGGGGGGGTMNMTSTNSFNSNANTNSNQVNVTSNHRNEYAPVVLTDPNEHDGDPGLSSNLYEPASAALSSQTATTATNVYEAATATLGGGDASETATGAEYGFSAVSSEHHYEGPESPLTGFGTLTGNEKPYGNMPVAVESQYDAADAPL